MLACLLLSAVPVVTGKGPIAAAEGDPPAPAVIDLAETAQGSGVLERVGGEPAAAVASPDDVLVVEATSSELEALDGSGEVDAVLRRGTYVHRSLAESVPAVGAPGRWAAGHSGAGQVVVVIDTGVAPDFGGSIIGQACFAGDNQRGFCGPSGSEWSAFEGICFDLGVCGDAAVEDPDAGRPCGEPAPPESCQHGSAVAAVAARHAPTPGVAPDADVYAIRVFGPDGQSADLVDVYYALGHSLALSEAGLDIAAVNLSVSSSQLFVGHCDAGSELDGFLPAFSAMVRRLEERGVGVVAAAGNDGIDGALAFPACLRPAIAVGATDSTGAIATFSNRSSALDLFAPGADRASAGVSDGLDIPSAPGYRTSWSGTSFSAPHVAGALGLLATDLPKATVAQRTWYLRAAGAPVPGSPHRRLRLGEPSAVVPGGLLFPGEVPGAGSIAASGDLDGDGRADLVLHGPGPAPDALMFGTDRWELDAAARAVSGSYQLVVGNFRGDPGGSDEILWYAPGPASDSIWSIDGARNVSSTPTSVSGTYRTVVGDYDGDGWDDVLWYAPGPAPDSIWFGGPSGFVHHALSISGTYEVLAGDFDGDGRDDLFFYAGSAGLESVWRSTATRGGFLGGMTDLPGGLAPAVGDLDGDGRDDLLLHGPGALPDRVWRGTAQVPDQGPSLGFAEVAWAISGSYRPIVGDFDGSGTDDVLWYAPGSAADSLWLLQPDLGRSVRSLSVSGAYGPVVADLDGSGSAEVVWFAAGAATIPLWWAMG